MSYPPFHPSRAEIPLTLSRDEFLREFPDENQFVEFKNGVGKIEDSAVAFSNADGGVILIGVSDDGEIIGRALDSALVDRIHERMRSIRDPGRYAIHPLEVDGRAITVISVAAREEGFAQMSNGVVRVRKGTLDEPLFGDELRRFINSRASRRFELTPTAIAIVNASESLVAEMAERFGWDQGSVAARLAEHGYAEGDRLTVAGALYALENPGEAIGKAHVEVLRYADDDSADYELRREITGPLPRQLEQAVDLVQQEVGKKLVVLGVRRHELDRVPPVVVREAVANAIAHRSYEDNRTPVRIELRPSRLVIRSPGGLPEPVTVENIREMTAPRNLAVIKALRRFGLAEDAGRGIDVIEDTMLDEMLDPPVFEDHGHEVVVTLPLHSAVAPEERAWVRELEHRGQIAGPERLLLVHAARGDDLTNARAREILRANETAARAALQRLRDRGFLEQVGKRAGTRYRLRDNLAPPAGLRLGDEEVKALIVELARDGPISNADVRAATGLDRTEARRLLAQLVKEEALVQTGARRGTRYWLTEK